MRPLSAVVAGPFIWAALLGGVATSSPAQAIEPGKAINGTYAATSDGNYATTNYAFHAEDTVRSTWTISSTCDTGAHCSGQVRSDQGWSAPLRNEGDVWYVERDLPNWETCPDGTSFTGHQTFQFYPADADGVTRIGSPHLEGKDKTDGERAACGIPAVAIAPFSGSYGKALTIVMQFRLDKLG